MRTQASTSVGGGLSWRGQVQHHEDDLVRELLEADDVDNVLARLEKDHYKRIFPALRTLTSFDSGATTMEAPSTNSAATTTATVAPTLSRTHAQRPPPPPPTQKPLQQSPSTAFSSSPPAPAAYSGRGGASRVLPPPSPPRDDEAETRAHGRTDTPPLPRTVTSPLAIPTTWLPSHRSSLPPTPRDAALAHAGHPPPPPSPPSAPRGAGTAQSAVPPTDGLHDSVFGCVARDGAVPHRDGSPAPMNPHDTYGIANRLDLSDPHVLTPLPDGAGLGDREDGGAEAVRKDGNLVPRFSTQTRSPSALGLYSGGVENDADGLENPAQSRIARQLQLLRNYRELADLCAKTSDPSESLFGAITPEALARQQADQIGARLGQPVTVNNNYFFGDAGSASRAGSPAVGAGGRHGAQPPAGGGGAGGMLRSHTPGNSRSRRTSFGRGEDHVDPTLYGAANAAGAGGGGRVPPPPPPRQSSSAQPSTADGTSPRPAAGLTSSHGNLSEASLTTYANTSFGGVVGVGATARQPQRRLPPPPPPPPPLFASQTGLSGTLNTSLLDSPMAQAMSGGAGHYTSPSAVTPGGATNTQHSPSRSQRSRSHRLQGMRDVTSTATTEEAGSLDDEEEEDEYPGDFLDADDGEFGDDYMYSEDPAPAPRIIEREQHRRPQRENGGTGVGTSATGGVVGMTNYSGGVGVAVPGSVADRPHRLDDNEEPRPREPHITHSTGAATTDGLNTIVDKGSFNSLPRGSGSGDRSMGGGGGEGSTRSVSRINVLSGQDALEADGPSGHTRRASHTHMVSGVGSRPRPSDKLDTGDAEHRVNLHGDTDARTGTPVDATQPVHGGDGSSRRASRSSGRTGETPEKQRARRPDRDRRGGIDEEEDDTPGNPQLRTRNPNAARDVYDEDDYERRDRRRRHGEDGAGESRRRGRTSRHHRRRPRQGRSRYASSPSGFSEGYDSAGNNSYSYSYSSDRSPYSSEMSFDGDRRRGGGAGSRGPVASRRQLMRGAPSGSGRSRPSPSPQERSGTRPHANVASSSGSPANDSGNRRSSLSSGPLARGRGSPARGGRARGGGGRDGPGAAPPQLSPHDVAAPGREGAAGARGASPGRATSAGRGRGRGAPAGRGRGAASARDDGTPVRRAPVPGGATTEGRGAMSPGVRSTASTPVWKQVGSTASTAVNSPRRGGGSSRRGDGNSAAPAPGAPRPAAATRPGLAHSASMSPSGQGGAFGRQGRAPSNMRVHPGLLYGSLLPTAPPRTAFVLDDPYSLANNTIVPMSGLSPQQHLELLQRQRQMQLQQRAGMPSARPTTGVWIAPSGNTTSPENPGNMALVGRNGEVQPLVWKSGQSATVMSRNRHMPAAPHTETTTQPSAPPSRASGPGILMNTSHNTTASQGGYYYPDGASPPPQAPAQSSSQPVQSSQRPAVTIQVPTNYQMPTSTPMGSAGAAAAERRRAGYGAASSSIAHGASTMTPMQARNNPTTPAQRFGIVSLSS